MTRTTISITPQTATRINKTLAILAIAAFAAAATAVFPSFGPSTAANAAPVPAKSDRLIANAAPLACAEQNWPNFNASCLRNGSSPTSKVRLVTTDKL